MTHIQSQAEIGQQRRLLQDQYQGLQARLGDLNAAIRRDGFSAEVATGGVVDIALANVVRVYQPNRMSVFGKSIATCLIGSKLTTDTLTIFIVIAGIRTIKAKPTQAVM